MTGVVGGKVARAGRPAERHPTHPRAQGRDKAADLRKHGRIGVVERPGDAANVPGHDPDLPRRSRA